MKTFRERIRYTFLNNDSPVRFVIILLTAIILTMTGIIWLMLIVNEVSWIFTGKRIFDFDNFGSGIK